jgi:hypothetical protein
MLGYIKVLEDNSFLITTTEGLYDGMVAVNEDVINRYFEEIQTGKVFKIKNIEGKDFEEIFKEYEPEPMPQPKSELQALKETVDMLIMANLEV